MAEEKVKLGVDQLLALHQNQRTQFQNLLQQINSMNNLLIETNLARDALKALDKPGKDEVLFSLGAGVYIDATVADLKKVKTNIGGNTVTETTPKKALEKLEERAESIVKNLKKLREQEMQMRKNLAELENALKFIEQQRRAAAPASETEKPTSDVS